MNENTVNVVTNTETAEQKIAVKDFVKKYNALTNDTLKEKQIDSIIKRHYVPVVEKRAAAEVIIEKSTQEKDGIEYIDSFLSKVGLMSAIISLYTNLDCNGNIFENYDLLMEDGIYPIIMYKIGEKDIKEFMSILASVEETFISQKSFEAFVAKQVTRFGALFGQLAGSGLESLSTVLGDEEKMKQAVGKLPKLDNIEGLLKLLNNKNN